MPESALSELAPPNPGGEQPQRVRSATGARDLIKRAEKAVEHRIEQYRAVADAYDRIPPDTEEELRADGLGWAANVDWGGMEAGIDEAKEQLLNLMMEPEQFVKFRSAANVQGKAAQLQALSEIDAEILRAWDEWEDAAQLMVHHRVSFGCGVYHWPTPNGWHFRALNPANLITPERAPLNPEKWAWAAVVTEFEIPQLLEVLTDTESAKETGWKIGNVRKAIEKWKGGTGTQYDQNFDVEALVHAFDRGTTWGALDDTTTIKGYILYVREWDGMISEHWLTNQDEVGFLFERNDKHRSMSSCISILPHGLGDGYLNRVRGYGVKMLPYHDTENRVMNHAIDVTWLASGMILKGEQDGLNQLPELQFGAFTILPSDFELLQSSFANPAGGSLQLLERLQMQKAGRNLVFGGDVDKTPNVDKTASGARMRYQEQTALRGNGVNRFYRQLERFHWVRIQRLLMTLGDENAAGYDLADAWMQSAMAAGVLPEVIQGITGVKVCRVFGDGDPVNQWLAMNDLLAYRGEMSAQGRRLHAKVAITSRVKDSQLADDLLGEAGMDDLDSRQRQIAQGENADFQTSDVRIDVAGTDHHVIHSGEHMVFMEDTMTQIDQQHISEEDGFRTLGRGREHMNGHMAFLEADPLSEEIFQDMQRRIANVDNRLRQLGQHLEAKRKAEQEQQLQQLRQPRLSVEEQERMLTERAKRDAIKAEAEHKKEMATIETEAKIEAIRADVRAKREQGKITDLKDQAKP